MAHNSDETADNKLPQLFPDLVYAKLTPAPQHPHFNYQGFHPGKAILTKGHVRSPGRRAFPADVVFDRDVCIRCRDGIRLYADVYRPLDSDGVPVPVVIPWSPYGKTGTGPQQYDVMAPYRAGIPEDRTSGYEKFEAPDPAEWCGERNIAMWGLQEAEDVYDVIEWCSRQPWCNGCVAMAGNSWLSMAQLNFASRLSHPALKAIAPWEGQTDVYRQFVARGGRPHNPKFHDMIKGGFAGPGYAELIYDMIHKRPLYDEYWEAKRFPIESIDNIPMYLLASYSTMLHTQGSFSTFRDAKTKLKWLRVHPYQEWYDIYRKESNDDLQRFFDRYCKGVQNGWEETPPVRLSLLGFEADGSPAETVLERPEAAYPPTRGQDVELYLDSKSMVLTTQPAPDPSSVSYEGHRLTSSADFTWHFEQAIELCGWSKLRLFVSCPDHDDMDIACQIRKIDKHGRPLQHMNYPVPVPVNQVPDFNTAKTLGPQGFLRASHAISLDRSKSHGNDLFYTHRTRKPIPKGEVIELEISMWPIGMVFAPGEGILLRISGHDMCLPETGLCVVTEPEDANVGTHVVHTGGKYMSSLCIPILPPE
ncbi:hypothetical protein BAUCODRAFT_123340 [Baudoinia panamericana UAMH 10762]|uniref:Xaa-Pro dipeptidyl-peptidase C-terminal domain-containing protein n=1 Tax=Baudoinia panamericana (strain UAMH 10762) TaxID=717646 RepID=M2MHI6_BAUPA|nr:uncharacterized protein BAUCODRAFT_123340 [Baudoinia panamericana UAMH 10762]EMC96066.1 hypothetical protein BAUCODRAFT_123340 [Baudoinia panamericana UAMH 10762]